MEKAIKLIKSAKDSSNPYLPLELTINKTSKLLTELFFGKDHPFRKRLEKKVFAEEIDERRIRFDLGGFAKFHKDPETGFMKMKFHVHELWLWVCMKDHRTKENRFECRQPSYMQTTYIRGKLEEYLHEQGVNVPCKNAEDIERLLNYLAKDIPCIWDYFKVVERKSPSDGKDKEQQ